MKESNKPATATDAITLGTLLGPPDKRPRVVKPLKPEEEELINRLVYIQVCFCPKLYLPTIYSLYFRKNSSSRQSRI